jgi:ankyrin repeat protein
MAIDKKLMQKSAVRMAWEALDKGDCPGLAVALAGAPDTVEAANSRKDPANPTSDTLLIGVVRNLKIKTKAKMESLQMLLECGADPLLGDRLGQTPAHWAAFFNQVECIQRLGAAGPAALDGSTGKGATPLRLAIGHFKAEAVQALIDAGASILRDPGEESLLETARKKLDDSQHQSENHGLMRAIIVSLEAAEIALEAPAVTKGPRPRL